MGDSRFYTYTQFFSVIVLVLLIIVAVSISVFYYFRIEKKKSTYIVFVLSITLSIFFSIYSLVAETVVYSVYYHNMFIILSLFHVAVSFYTIYVFENIRKNLKKFQLSCLALSYAVSIVLLFSGKYVVFSSVLLSINFVLLSMNTISFKVSEEVFKAVKKSLPNYVFILSAKGYVIYMNDKVKASGLFKSLQRVDINYLENIFKGEVIKRELYDETVYCINHLQTKLTLIKKEIFSGDELEYIVLTFSDVSRLILLLDELEEKREYVFKANIELERYKDRVYELEKKRAIYSLLDDVVSTQYDSMNNLRDRITELNREAEGFVDSLEEIIKIAKDDLKEVRAVVSTYRN